MCCEDTMDEQPSVAAFITTYNAENTLEKTLRSVEWQNYDNLDVWIYDDASTDNTTDILKNYKQQSNRDVHLFLSNENTGHPYHGLNQMLERCEADLIAVNDHDDLWHPQKTLVQVQAWQDHSVAAVGSNRWLWYEDQDRMTRHRREQTSGWAQHTTLLFENRDGWRYPLDVTKKDMAFQHDVITTKVYNVQHPLVIHRIQDNHSSLSSTWTSLKDIPRIAQRDGFFEATYEAYQLLLPKDVRNWLSHAVFKPHLSQKPGLDATWAPVRLKQ